MQQLHGLQAALGTRYAIERQLGAGGMADVYLAQDTKHGRRVAIKVLRAELTTSVRAQRFHQEIRVAAQLHHPHILPLLDSGETGNVLFYIMPFVEGPSLRESIARHGALSVERAVRMLTEVVDALAYAHSRGIVHRDIKPDNILLTGRHALVSDFGVAKAIGAANAGAERLTSDGAAMGTPAYMAPEQAAGEADLDHRIDIYAVGVLAYEMLAGEPPFTGSPQQVIAAHITANPPSIAQRRDDIPAELATAIARCLEKEREARFSSADELLAALEPMRKNISGVSRAGRRRRTMWMSAAGAAVLVTAAALVLRLDDGSLQLGTALPVTSEAGLEIDPALSPDGRHVAYVTGPLHRARVYVRQAGGRAIGITPDTGAAHRFPRWSPDGNQLLFVQGSAIMTVPAFSGIPQVMARASETVLSAAWAPSGTSVAYGTQDTLFVISLDGGAPRPIVIARQPHAIAWSPDGRWLAFVASSSRFTSGDEYTFGDLAPSDVFVVGAQGGRAERVTDGVSMNLSPVWMPDSRRLMFVSDREGPRDVYALHVRDGRAHGAPTRVSAGLNAHSISLSSDGTRLAYAHYVNRSNLWSLPLREGGIARSTDARPLTTGTEVIESASVSPDGRRIYFDSDRAGNSDIYRIDLPGGEPVQLTNHPAREFAASESPDGRWVIFHGFRFGSRDLFLMPSEGGAVRRVTSDTAHELSPHWSPSGQRLSYLRLVGGETRRVVADRLDDTTWSQPTDVGPFTGMNWLDDSTWVMADGDGGIEVLSLGSGKRRSLYAPSDLGFHVHGLQVRRANIFARTRNPEGTTSYWRIDGTGRRTLVATWDDPDRPITRSAFTTDGRTLYFTFADRQSDIFLAQLKAK